MKSTKKVFRFIELSEARTCEAYLADMAKSGWRLEKMGLFTMTFCKMPAQKQAYKILFSKSGRAIQENELVKAGLLRAICLGNYYVIGYDGDTQDARTQELVSTLVEQNAPLKSPSLFGVFLCILFFVSAVPPFFLKPPLLAFLTEPWYFGVGMCIVCLHMMGVPQLQKRETKKKRNWKNVRVSMIACLSLMFLLLGCVSFGLAQQLMQRPQTLSDRAKQQVMVDLTDIESASELQIDSVVVNGVDAQNRIEGRWSLLVPKQLNIRQKFSTTEEHWRDGSRYNPSLETHHYVLSIPFFAKPMAREMAKDHVVVYPGSYVETQDARFDLLLQSQGEYYISIIVARGNQVVLLQYIGMESAGKILALLDERI